MSATLHTSSALTRTLRAARSCQSKEGTGRTHSEGAARRYVLTCNKVKGIEAGERCVSLSKVYWVECVT